MKYTALYWTMVDGKLIECSNKVCWAGLRYNFNYDLILNANFDKFEFATIYIGDYDRNSTREYQDVLVSTINEITPCQKEMIEGKELIKLKLLKTYDQSLIILNFIRNLWYDPLPSYALDFFVALMIANHDMTFKDPLSRLLWANKEACKHAIYSCGHSNVHKPNKLKIKTVPQLLGYMGDDTYRFLTQ